MSDQDKQPKRRGRPPKYAGEGKRQNFSFRIRSSVRDQLIAAVAESGRSLSEEIEYRLEQSFELPKLMDTMAEKAVTKIMTATTTASGTSVMSVDATVLKASDREAEAAEKAKPKRAQPETRDQLIDPVTEEAI